MRSRLWGAWQSSSFPSGTVITHLTSDAHKPHLYVYADRQEDADAQQLARSGMCDDLAAYLNGAPRPAWLAQYTRQTETLAESTGGGRLTATGPSIDRTPPLLDWVQDESAEAQAHRTQLLDVLFPELSNA